MYILYYRSKLTPPVVSDSDNQNSSPEIKKSDVSFVNNNSNEDDKSSVFLSNVCFSFLAFYETKVLFSLLIFTGIFIWIIFKVKC